MQIDTNEPFTETTADKVVFATNRNLPADTLPLSLEHPIQPMLFAKVVNDTTSQWKLNSKQRLAFKIAADCFKDIIDERCLSGTISSTPLHMLMEGPGGTGKTHVINALKSLLDKYDCGHKIRFLAPTGGAAALINGQTIHKGLGIAVHSTIGKSSKDNKMCYRISLQKQDELRQEW